MNGLFALVRFVSLRHLAAGKLRTFLVLLGVALGVAMVVGTQAANEAIASAFDDLTDRAAGKADLEITGDESGVDQTLVDALVDRPELAAHAAGRIEQTTFLEDGTRVLVLGVDFLGDLSFVPFAAEKGADPFRDALAFVADPHAVLVTGDFARARGLSVGSKLRVRTGNGVEELHVEAILRETGSARAFGGQVLILSLDAAQLAFAREGKVDRIDVVVPHWVPFEDAKAKLGALVGARGRVDRPSKRAASLARMTAAFRGGLQVTALVALLIGMFLVSNAVGVAVAQRRREIGVLRGLGASRRAVVSLFVAEAAIVGLVGGALGVLLGSMLARSVVQQFAPNVSRFFEPIATPAVHVSRGLALRGVVLGVLASAVAALGPARRAAAVAPVESLRRGVARPTIARPTVGAAIAGICGLIAIVALRKPSAASGAIAIVALFVAAPALSPLAVTLAARVARVLPIAMRLGVEAITRDVGRSAWTIAAVTVATALGMTLSAYTHSYERTCLDWVEQAIPADVIVSAGSPLMDRYALAFSPDAARAVAGREVESMNLVRSMSIPYGDFRLEVTSLETETYLARLATREDRRVLRGPKRLPVDALSRAPSVLVSENFAWKTHLGPGDDVELPSPSGVHRFRIVAVVADYSTDQGWMLIDRKFALEYWKDARVEGIHVYLKPGVDPNAAADAIRARVAAATGAAGLFVITNAAAKKEIRAVIEQTFGISRAAETIAAIVAVLAVIGTMIAAVLDRTRELGVLRALGASRRQVLRMVLVEAATLGAVSSLLAMVVSIPASMVFVDVLAFQASGWSVPLSIPWFSWARVAIAVVALAALAGLLPAVRAARTIVGRALAWE